MSALKNTLAALFVGEVGFLISTIAIVLIGAGVNANKVTGVGALFHAAFNPVTLIVALVFFLGSLLLFIKY